MDKNHLDKKYESVKIPERNASRDGQVTPFSVPSKAASSVSMEDGFYYEIEYDSCPIPGAGKFVRKPVKVEPPPRDEIRELFGQMRDIARECRTYSVNSSRFYDKRVQQENARIFYKQGMFLKDFEDHYEKAVPYSAYYPFYQMMGYEQLRTYFTWRTKVRTGVVEETSLSYAYLYLYELINNIGVEDPEDGLDKLMFFWKEYRRYDPTIDRYVIRWLKDYHIYYELPQSFPEFIAGNGLESYYPEMKETDDFELMCSVSKYDLRKSVFYKEGDQKLIRECFFYTTDRLKKVFEENGLSYEETVFQPVNGMTVWTPFKEALFYPWKRQRDRRVVLSEKEIYVCSQNTWKFNKVLTTDSGKQFLGYVMKQTEAVLREMTNYRYSITAGIGAVNPVTVSILAAVGISLEKLITDTVKEFYREATKTVVVVDPASLEQIRKDARITQEKLTVPEEEEIVLFTAKEPKKSILPVPEVSDPGNGLPANEWEELGQALDNTEKGALVRILQGETDLKQYADKHGVMLEVLADGINEKAMDIIGDSILDEEFLIYEDYREQVEEMMK